MSKIPGFLKVTGVLVVVIAIGVGIGMLSSDKPARNAGDQPAPAVQPAPADNSTLPGAVSQTPPIKPLIKNASPIQPAPQNPPQLTVPTPQNVITNWEARLDDILEADVEENEKAKQMAEILPNLPAEGQMEVAQHLANLTLDEDYAMVGRFLTDATLPEDVLDVFIADSLNRPNAVKLPLLLEVAQNPQHPKAEEAREILELFLEEDYGTNWQQWKIKLDEWIKNNPD
jgi:hypothetical protein